MYRDGIKASSLKALLVFEAAARHLSFTRAGLELHITQGAVSRQIQRLEERLGFRLFNRVHRAIELSEEGLRLYLAVSSAMATIDATIDEIHSRGRRRSLSVGASPAMASFWLMPRLERFASAHPDIDLRIVACDRIGIGDLTRLGAGLDVVFCCAEGPWRGLSATHLCREEIYPVCSPGYLAAHPELRGAADLLNATLLHMDEDQEHLGWLNWRAWLKRQGVTGVAARRGVWVNSYPLLLQAAQAGQGVALGWSVYVEDALAAGSLVRPIEATLLTGQDYYLVTGAGAGLEEQIEAFRGWVLAETGAG